jgi:hypothetical protein
LGEYPPDLLEEQQKLSTLMVELIRYFKDDITIHVIDPQSLMGIITFIKYRVRKYPAFIIDGKELIIGWNRDALDDAIKTGMSYRDA